MAKSRLGALEHAFLMPAVPLTSAGITEFADRLHATALRLDEEVRASSVFGQSFIGPWTDYLQALPWADLPPLGLLALVDEIRSPFHVISPTADFGRLRRFERRMQELYDDGKRRGQDWSEPRPPTSTPGSSGPTTSASLGTLALVGFALWMFMNRRD